MKRVQLIRGAYYWQPTKAVRDLGFAAEALGKDPEKAAARGTDLNRQVEEERRRKALGVASGARPGSVAALVDTYQTSGEYLNLRATTRKTYDGMLRQIRARHEHKAVSEIKRNDLRSIFAALQKTGKTHKPVAVMKMWAILLAFAVREEWISRSPADKLVLPRAPARQVLWPAEYRRRFIQAAIASERRSVALGLVMLWTFGQRLSDTLGMTWGQWDGSGMLIRQSKTGTRLRVAATRYGRLWIKGTERQAVQIIVSETTGRPYDRYAFNKAARAIREMAGLPDTLQLRDMRRTVLTELGNAGASVPELRAVGGHRTGEMLDIYVLPTDQQSRSAQGRRDGWRERKPTASMKPPRREV